MYRIVGTFSKISVNYPVGKQVPHMSFNNDNYVPSFPKCGHFFCIILPKKITNNIKILREARINDSLKSEYTQKTIMNMYEVYNKHISSNVFAVKWNIYTTV